MNQKLVVYFNQISYSVDWSYWEVIYLAKWRHARHNLITINGKTVITKAKLNCLVVNNACNQED